MGPRPWFPRKAPDELKRPSPSNEGGHAQFRSEYRARHVYCQPVLKARSSRSSGQQHLCTVAHDATAVPRPISGTSCMSHHYVHLSASLLFLRLRTAEIPKQQPCVPCNLVRPLISGG